MSGGEEILKLVKVDTDIKIQLENDIRQKVFIEEQDVDPKIEYDEFEATSIHYLLYKGEEPIGCSRYRHVGNEIKLERYAIYKEERGKGYGRYIMERMLDIVLPLKPRRIFLHSQTVAQGFYTKCGFRPYGEKFSEADIDHIKMYYPMDE